MDVSLRNEWCRMIEVGKNVRDGNGLAVWQPYKQEFSKIPGIFDVSKMKPLFAIVSYFGTGKDHEDAQITIGNQPLKYAGNQIGHFVVQLFRIPMMCNFQLPYVKLMQIAYNIGQALAHFEEYEPIVKAFFVTNSLDDLEIFV